MPNGYPLGQAIAISILSGNDIQPDHGRPKNQLAGVLS